MPRGKACKEWNSREVALKQTMVVEAAEKPFVCAFFLPENQKSVFIPCILKPGSEKNKRAFCAQEAILK